MGPDFGVWIGLALDTIACLAFMKLYNVCRHTREKIKGANDVEIGPELLKNLQESESGCTPYVCVRGVVRPVGKALQSQFNSWQEGVIQRSVITEHKSKKVQGLWSDVKKVIHDSTQDVPFSLQKLFWQEEDGPSHVYVMEPRQAEYLMEDLTSTYDEFVPNKSSLVQRMFDRFFGDIHEGTQFSEEMLLCDTLLSGFGKIALVNGKMHLRPPESGYKYILTKLTKAEVIKKFENRMTTFKVLCYITGIIGSGVVVYLICKHYKDWKRKRESEQFLNEARNARTEKAIANRNQNVSSTDSENVCVVCLNNPREVILLNCGHICVCAECMIVLPQPLKCPVCRQSVERYLHVYNP